MNTEHDLRGSVAMVVAALRRREAESPTLGEMATELEAAAAEQREIVTKLRAEVARLRAKADPPRCGNCIQYDDGCRGTVEENEDPCNSYARAALAGKEVPT